MGIDQVNTRLRRAVFVDRDGVLNAAIVRNGKPYPPSSIEELEIPEEVATALVRLKRSGFVLIGITNQPDVARGTQTRKVVEAINDELLSRLPLECIKVCYHDDNDHCECRKPRPGLLLEASDEYQIDLSSSYMVGDRWKDIEAGRRAGCRAIWLDRHYDERKPEPGEAISVSSLMEAADIILNSRDV